MTNDQSAPLSTTTSQERIDTIIHDLQGTCRSLYEVATDEEQNDPAVTAAIDSQIFLCEVCGWWFDRCEESSRPGVCEDDHDEEQPEDEE